MKLFSFYDKLMNSYLKKSRRESDEKCAKNLHHSKQISVFCTETSMNVYSNTCISMLNGNEAQNSGKLNMKNEINRIGSSEKSSPMLTREYKQPQQKHTNLVHQILCEQDLSHAGNIFSLNSQQLLSDFPKTIEILKTIIDNRNYVFNLNEQTIVEIVLTKCLSALRETQLLGEFYDDLLDLIEICLKYDLNNRRKSVILTAPISARSTISYGTIGANDLDEDSFQGNSNAHANVISDIFSSILLEYFNPELSMKTIPTCIKLIQHPNVKPELTREVCSYLSLIANRMPELLVDYVYYIVNAIKMGHTSLTYLLFQISEINIDCIYPFVRHIIKILDKISSVKDFGYVLQVMYLISLNHIQLFIVHLEDLMKYLNNKNYEEYMFDIIYSVASQTPIELDLYLNMFDTESFLSSYKVDKILGTVGKSLKRKAEACTCILINRLKWNLKLLRGVTKTKQAVYRHSYCPNQTKTHPKGEETVEPNGENDMFDLIHLRKSLTSHMSRNRAHYKKSHSYSHYPENGTNDETKASKAVQDDGDDENQIEECLKRCFSILNEIYDIAQTHPHVLDTNLKTIRSLFAHPPECLAPLLSKIEELQMENSSISFPSKTASDNSNKSDSCSSYILDYNDQQELENEQARDKFDLSEGTTRTFLENNFFEESRREFNVDESQFSRKYLLDMFEQKPTDRIEKPEVDEEIRRLNNGETLTITLNNASVYEISRLEQTRNDYFDLSNKSNEEDDIDKLEDVSFKCAIPTQQHRDYSDNIEDYQDKIDDLDELATLSSGRISTKKLSFFNRVESETEETRRLLDSCSVQDKFFNRHDLVEQFCTKHLDKIKLFANKLTKVLPMPSIEAMIEAKSSPPPIRSDSLRKDKKSEKKDLLPFKCANRKLLALKFNCACQGSYCLYSKNYFRFRTTHVAVWIHCMFLFIQSEMNEPLCQNHRTFSQLRQIYERFNEKLSFNALVTSSFPSEKQINELVNELNKSQYFDLFKSIEQTENSSRSMWSCCLCSNPNYASSLMDEKPLLKGELKEKHGKLKFLRRWNKRMFTLIDGNIVYFKKDMRQESLNVKYIRTIQPLRATSSISKKKERPNSKAFEIFTNRNSFILKAENSTDAQQWMHYLHLLKALEDSRSIENEEMNLNS